MGERRARGGTRDRRALAQHREPRRHPAHLARLLCDDPLPIPPAARGADSPRGGKPAQSDPDPGQRRPAGALDVLLDRQTAPVATELAEMTRRSPALAPPLLPSPPVPAAPVHPP